jgi:hypothetical protein
VSESTGPTRRSRPELDELIGALRQPPRLDELTGEPEAVASVVAALESRTNGSERPRERTRRLHLAALAAALVVVLAGAGAAASHLLKPADTHSVVPSEATGTSSLAVTQSGAIEPQGTSNRDAASSSSEFDSVVPASTTAADNTLGTVTGPATSPPGGAITDSPCVDEDQGTLIGSTVRDIGTMDESSSPGTTTTTVCRHVGHGGSAVEAATSTGQTQVVTPESDPPSNTAPGQAGQPGPPSGSPSDTAPGQAGQPGTPSGSPSDTAPGQVGQPGRRSDSQSDTASGGLDRPVPDQAHASNAQTDATQTAGGHGGGRRGHDDGTDAGEED